MSTVTPIPTNVEATPERTRTVSWEDPLPTAAHGLTMSGLEFLQAFARGEIPLAPFSRLIGLDGFAVELGRSAFTVTPAEYHYNPIGLVHGGLAATLLDSAMGCAVHSHLDAGQTYCTVELAINYVRPISVATGRIRCDGETIHVGGRLATAEGRIVAEKTGKLLAHGKATCMILPAPEH
jgi:uncharacterized protein (TIGR00369 family)